MSDLKYDAMMQMGGIITNLQDGAVTMDLKGRLGMLKVPMRMLITDYELKVGQEVVFTMTMPQVISPEPNLKYVSNIAKNQRNSDESPE